MWGFGFIATIWTLESISPLCSMLVRFGVSFLVGEFISLVIFKHAWTWQQLKISLPAGLFLGITLLVQTLGLEYTTATNSGFITTLYVVFVPLFGRIFFKQTLQGLHLICILVALLGTALLVNLHHFQLNTGDALTFICALTASVQILYVGNISHKIDDAFRFNNFQSLWSTLLALTFIPLDPAPFRAPFSLNSTLGLLSITFCSTLFAFFLQIRAQKILSANASSLLLLLESPFAFFFAFLLLNERPSFLQLIGAALILIAAFASVQLEARKSHS